MERHTPHIDPLSPCVLPAVHHFKGNTFIHLFLKMAWGVPMKKLRACNRSPSPALSEMPHVAGR